MKNLLTAFSMTQTMFCTIPFPLRRWEESSRLYMLLFLPVVGLEIGVLWYLGSWLMGWFGIPAGLYGFAMTAIPFLLTGGIHLDGFMDVADAIGSWRELEKRRAILKDSHVGAVAVLWLSFLLLGSYGVFSSFPSESIPACLILIPVVSRCCSCLAVWKLKSMNTSQYSGSVTPNWCIKTIWCLLALCIAAGFFFFGISGASLIVGVLAYGIALRKSYKLLDGMNGDISGFCISISEVCAAAALVLLGGMV